MLEQYRAKRDFAVTPEPSGEAPVADGHRFVVQHHRARSPHYDFRLEAAGVLVSWAVPKGPTLDPKVRRMAVHVEDHPLDYFDFEGVIPRGEYGGGDVIVWDWGTWELAQGDDPMEAIAAGDLHFALDGQKLRGRFVLVRRGRGARQDGTREQWLLLHKRDDFAVAGWDPEAHPESVKSGRTNDEVAADPGATWHSDRAAKSATASRPTRADWADELRDWPSPTGDELDALAALGSEGLWAIADHELKVTHLDKVLFPAHGATAAVTKRDLIAYHTQIAPHLLPYLSGRPVNTQRFPEGIDGKGFWQKAAPKAAPDWIPRWHNDGAAPDQSQDYLVLDSPAALAWAANYGTIELNPWTSRAAHPDQPTWALIDIDPGAASTFDDVVVIARLYRAALDHLGLVGAPKLTGKRGVQIWVPAADGYSYQDTLEWVEQLSHAIGDTVPELVSWEWKKAARGGRARLDYTQNGIGKTLVAPFSLRPEPGAPVSVPIEWDELDDPELRPDRWNIDSVLDRVAEAGDPLRPLIGLQQRLPDLSALAAPA